MNRRIILGSVIGASLLSAVPAARAQVVPTPTKTVESLPDQVDLVMSVRGLSSIREKPQGRALERFLTECSDWARTASAWMELSRRMDFGAEQAIDSLLGNAAVLAVDGASEQDSPLRFVVITLIRPEQRRALGGRLGAVPRSVAGNVPVLAVESGAFQLAMPAGLPGVDEGAWSQLVLSSDKPLFEGVMGSLGTAGRAGTLGARPEWARIEPLTSSDLFLLARGRDAGGTRPDEFLALSGTVTSHGWTARFLASDAVVDGGIVGIDASPVAWPSEAVDALEQDATLLVAGSPSFTHGKPATLMSSLLGMMSLPAEVRQNLQGTAIVAVHAPESTGGSMTIALPLRSIEAAVNAADAWACSVAGMPVTDTNIPTVDGIRHCTFGAERAPALGGMISGDGRAAWCYAAAGGVLQAESTPGWLVLSVRFGEGEEPQAMVRRTASHLAHGAMRDQSTLFRLVVQPRRMMALMEASKPVTDSASAGVPVNRRALRWLDRVDSRIVRESKGYVEGTINAELNLKLLASPTPTAGAQRETTRGQGE
ncbi:MAG TPA: hypothetical protein VD997_00505 [Phycisphaerales bacterium]|nr:hypothetical protein [Phycisphaerales bacterium]